MRLMQHMLPGLLAETPDPVFVRPAMEVPEGAVLQKSIVSAIAGAVAGIAQPIADIVTSPANNRTAQELARQETLRTQMLVADAASARAANMQMLKYAVGAGLIGLTLFLILK